MKYVVLIVLLLCTVWFYQYNNAGSRRLSVQKKDLSPSLLLIFEEAEAHPDIQDIQALNTEFFKVEDPELKAFLVRLIALGFLATDPNSFRRFKIFIDNKYPDEGYLNFMDEEFPVICPNCQGECAKPCKQCQGSGQCSNDKCNKGQVSSKLPNGKTAREDCFTCRGSGMCKECSGSGLADKSCATCGGSGRKSSQTQATTLYRQTLEKFK